METAYQKVLYNPCFLLVLRHGIQKTKEHILHKGGFVVFYSKNNFCIMIKIKHYTEITFSSKNVIFLYISKIFFTLLHLKYFWKILYSQNIVVCREPFIVARFICYSVFCLNYLLLHFYLQLP